MRSAPVVWRESSRASGGDQTVRHIGDDARSCKATAAYAKKTGRSEALLLAGPNITSTCRYSLTRLSGGWGADENREDAHREKFEVMNEILACSLDLQEAQNRQNCDFCWAIAQAS